MASSGAAGVRAMGLDLGTKRIGVAVSSGTLATPYDVVHRSGSRRQDHEQLAALAEEIGADMVVVGLPLSLDGTDGPAARRARKEIVALESVLSAPIEIYDERLTTVTAERSLLDMGLGAAERRKVVDQVAAAVILQAWIDAREAQR